MKKIDFRTASFKDFEHIAGMDIMERARYFRTYLDYLAKRRRLNYRLESSSPCGPEMRILLPGHQRPKKLITMVSNDYLGFTQHPEIIRANITAMNQYGTGSGASPAIGGHFAYHQLLEDRIAAFYGREHALLYTTGYTANSATLQCLLGKDDIAILDMAVHASVYEGCQLTNVKRVLHNNMDMLNNVLKQAQHSYRTKLVVVDGVYSQDGDLAPLHEITHMAHHYGAYVLMDDAHGTGVVGATGRGVAELTHTLPDIDIITGTFSKSLAHLGGYVVADDDLIQYLKYQSRQHLFSTSAGPSTLGIVRALELIDEEPQWRTKLWENIDHLTYGLLGLGLDIGTTGSAIVPVKIGDIAKTLEAGKQLLRAGVYANPIMYPAVAKKDARIRLNVMATHTQAQLDRVLEAFASVKHRVLR